MQMEVVAGIQKNEKLITILNLDSASVQERILKNIA
jgi:putative methionine-R-sulfoxide reductase with GAF domain